MLSQGTLIGTKATHADTRASNIGNWPSADNVAMRRRTAATNRRFQQTTNQRMLHFVPLTGVIAVDSVPNVLLSTILAVAMEQIEHLQSPLATQPAPPGEGVYQTFCGT